MTYELRGYENKKKKGAGQVSSTTLQINDGTRIRMNLIKYSRLSDMGYREHWILEEKKGKKKSRPGMYRLDTIRPVHPVIRQCSRWLTILG